MMDKDVTIAIKECLQDCFLKKTPMVMIIGIIIVIIVERVFFLCESESDAVSGNTERDLKEFWRDEWIDYLIKTKALVIMQKRAFEERFKLDLDEALLPITQTVRDYEKNVITFFSNREFVHFRLPYVEELNKRLVFIEQGIAKNQNDFTVYIFRLQENWYGALAPVRFR